jgi:hypothetical protein
MKVIVAARAVVDAIGATADAEPLAAAQAFEHLSGTMVNGESVLDLLAFEDLQAELSAPTP